MKAPRIRADVLAFLLVAAATLFPPVTAWGQTGGDRLVVFNAGSLASVFRDLLKGYRETRPDLDVRQETSGSLEATRKLTDLGRIPDVLAVADFQLIPELLFPRHAVWYATFARNALVLIHSSRSVGGQEISSQNWWEILQRSGVRVGRSEPALDPAGYRTLMALQLAERHYRRPGLARALRAAMPERYVRPKEVDLIALLQAGELDYAWGYRTMATTAALEYTALPPEVDLSDPALAPLYATVSVRVPGARVAGPDSVTIRGEPILYALTIPTEAPHPAAAVEFVRFLYSSEGQVILRRHGFRLLDRPETGGPGRPPAGLIPATQNTSSQRPTP